VLGFGAGRLRDACEQSMLAEEVELIAGESFEDGFAIELSRVEGQGKTSIGVVAHHTLCLTRKSPGLAA